MYSTKAKFPRQALPAIRDGRLKRQTTRRNPNQLFEDEIPGFEFNTTGSRGYYLMRRSLDILRKFQWMILRGYDLTCIKAHLLEDKQIPSVGVFDEVFLALGWLLEEIHVTWAHLEKKRTRLRTYTKSHDDFCKQWLETALQA
ncbi:hypothetical protein Tco_0020337 [Tanacetum coccineum]